MSLNPEPEFDGECAFAVSTGKRNVLGSSKHTTVDTGRTYYFKIGVARLLRNVLPNRAAKADAVWAATAPS